ncbi:MAG TPA: hypothetical protein VGO93_21575 [Candidatus Xenobia bacterium]|jgi:hypothetical protein
MNKVLFSLMAAGLLLVGCNPPAQESAPAGNTMQGTSSSSPAAMASSTTETASGSPEAPSGSTTISAANGTTVAIEESDTGLKMPSVLPAGSISFKVTNSGKKKHNVEIKGNGVDEKMKTPLDAGASDIFDVTLKPGTYHVTDPGDAKLKATLEIKS